MRLAVLMQSHSDDSLVYRTVQHARALAHACPIMLHIPLVIMCLSFKSHVMLASSFPDFILHCCEIESAWEEP